jgi:hypothetical protein
MVQPLSVKKFIPAVTIILSLKDAEDRNQEAQKVSDKKGEL